MSFLIDPSQDLSYSALINSANLTGTITSGSVNLVSYKGKVAIIVNAAAAGGTTAGGTIYFQTGSTPNYSNANPTNINVSSFNLSANTVTTNPVTSISSLTLNGSNQTLVVGLDTRATNGGYLFGVANIAGTNAPNQYISVVVLGTKSFETS